MKVLLILFLLSPSLCFAQKIFIDKIDPFNNVRTLGSDNSTLWKISSISLLQFEISVTLQKDSLQQITFGFTTPDNGVSIIKSDTSQSECMIKGNDGEIFNGKFLEEAKANVANQNLTIYACTFTVGDFYKMALLPTIAVRIASGKGDGGTFQIDKNAQDKIAKTCQVLIDKIHEK